jgi:tetratricopeptide (TPR) repeat protein
MADSKRPLIPARRAADSACAIVICALQNGMNRFRTSMTLLVLLLGFIAPPAAKADIIYLNDGNVLVVDKAWVDGEVVRYQTSRGVQSMPGTLVRQIREEQPTLPASPQRWSLGVVSGAGANAPDVSAPRDAEFSREALGRLRDNLSAHASDARAKAELVYALNAAGSLQLAQGDLPGAQSSLDEALNLDRRNPVILSNLAFVDFRMGNYPATESLLQTTLDIDRNNPDVYYLLGEAYYREDKISDAIDQWTAGLRLGPHAEMTKRLDKARQEAGVQNDMSVLQSAHFILRYDRNVSDPLLGQEILIALEKLYAQLSRELSSRPPATVVVILYPDQAYFNITRAASWSGALFDGKIRIPIKGLTSITPELTAILIHELTHSFIDSLPGRDCPAWFNEGVAQLEEGSSAANAKKLLVQLRQTNQWISLSELEGTFNGFPAQRAEVAYLESLAAVEYIAAQFGRGSIRNILDLMAQNYNFNNAFQTVLRRTVPELQSAWQQSLTP